MQMIRLKIGARVQIVCLNEIAKFVNIERLHDVDLNTITEPCIVYAGNLDQPKKYNFPEDIVNGWLWTISMYDAKNMYI